MNIIETIKKRRSVRSYTGEPLRDEHIVQINQYIKSLQAPFGEKARIELISVHSGEKPVKLGTYGFVKGATDYLVLIHEESPFAETASAYMFEQAVLFCTDLGLGTCWLGRSFSRNDFKKQVELKPNEKIRIVSPVGYASEKRHFIEKFIVNADKKSASRKPFETLFFDRSFDTPLTKSTAGIFLQALEMVRLAPSALNKQEWRTLRENNVMHFYRERYLDFDAIDIGIALCHFELTCKELGIEGKFEILNSFPKNEKLKYTISWVSTPNP